MKHLPILALCLLMAGCWETSKGVKLGTIVKCANEGVLIKTYECELIRGGLNDGSGSFGRSFHFTVPSALVSMASDALESQREVKLSYHQELLTLWRTKTEDNSFADSIEFK